MSENSRKIVKEHGKNGEGWVEQKVDGDSKAAGCSWQDNMQDKTDTGGKEVITQWVHGEFIVSFETIRLVNTHQVCVEYF